MQNRRIARVEAPQHRVAQHWVLLVYGGNRSYAGNPGYSDIPSAEYRFDSSVPNHKRLATGDLVAIRTRAGIEGFAKIAAISTNVGTRVRRECPRCGIPDLRERQHAVPRYRCRKGHEFDEPAEKLTECTQYLADFDGSFVRLSEPLAPELAIAMRRSPGAQQFSIQPADFNLIDTSHLPAQVKAWISDQSAPRTLGSVEADEAPLGRLYEPGMQDSQEAVMHQIRARRGQQLFRDRLLEIFRGRCVITDCEIVDLLEAAHIYPYRSQRDNHASNGLLLRADIHTLFDLHLVAIDPSTLAVCLHPVLHKSEYRGLAGHSLMNWRKTLSEVALQWRWQLFTEALRTER